MPSPWTQTTTLGRPEYWVLGGREQRGEMGDIHNIVNNKKKLKATKTSDNMLTCNH